MPKRHPNSIRYVLAPDPQALDAIHETMRAYGRMMEILDGVDVAKGGRANLAEIHASAYQRVRDETGLPSRLVTIGLRDHSLRVPGDPVTSFPLDEKLFALKGPDTVSLSTLAGRFVVPYRVDGYRQGWRDFAPARLHVGPEGIEIRIGVDVNPGSQEGDMIQEGILGRMGRVIAGMANAAIDGIEARTPQATVEQAIREIDKAIEEARGELGKDQAEAHRVGARIAEVEREARGLDEKIALALKGNREDLARAGVARQVDLEAQLVALRRAGDDIAGRIDEGSRGLAAARAARRDAEARLAELRKSVPEQGPGAGKAARRGGPSIEASLNAIERVTGVPGKPDTGGAEMDELERIHRDNQIEERLARFRGGTPQ